MKPLPCLSLVALLLQGAAAAQEIVAQNEAEITLGYVVRPL